MIRLLRELDATMGAVAGGKGANLGELMRVGDGVVVPDGFCVTTEAYRGIVAGAAGLGGLLDRIAGLSADDRAAIGALSAEVRRAIEDVAIPGELADAIVEALSETDAYAVRSSATAEDLPTASFAGQQDSYLNVVGAAEVLRHISRCWASLFTERAVTYRLRNGFDQRQVAMAVVVQRMVVPDASGVLFTADPVTGNRKVATVDAVLGLGEDLVSGLVTPDTFRVRDGDLRDGEVRGSEVISGTRSMNAGQVRKLVALGRRIEAHFGRPQDIEWCRTGDDFVIVQSRPITTLFPIPESDDGQNHVYLSVGHQQMMTDAMKPLGLSCWQLTAMAPMQAAGGRLFVDAIGRLASPAIRAGFLDMMEKADPLFRDALQTVLDRGDLVPTEPDQTARPDEKPAGPRAAAPEPIATDPAIVTELVRRSEESLATLKQDIAAKSGPELFDFLLEAFEEHKRVLADPLSIQAIMAGMDATWWLNEHLEEWLGERNAADTLTLSAPGNITSEMGLALLDVADEVRARPETLRTAVRPFLDRYGMRCTGEIDITRPRWSEQPETLTPLILDNVRTFEPGEAARRFERGRVKAAEKEAEILARLRAQPDGERKAAETKEMIDRVRTFIGYREYPKYNIICRYFVYKQAMLAEAGQLTENPEDVFYLTFQELREAVRTNELDHDLIRRRKEEFRAHQALTPPRVLTSDGEALSGEYRRDDVPAGALPGLAVSTGTVEGRARVVLDLGQADLEPGDILVTAHTDPSWSPLFVAVAGLVTEVGGLMTHGAVIAREYGLPAVVGVDGATRLIQDGQQIRVHGAAGYVELLT